MAFDRETAEIINNTDENRFELALNGEMAFVEYMLAGKNLVLTHTEVPVAYEGQGIAGFMAKYVLDDARQQGYKVQPLCPFMRAYIIRHPEYQDIAWGF